MARDQPTDITIIGGGFTGAALVLHLARRAPRPLRVAVIEPSGTLGYGLAYGTRNPLHRINVPAGRMRVFEDAPDDFLLWTAARDLLSDDPDALGRDGAIYPRRYEFGRYMAERLAQRVPGRLDLQVIEARAEDVVPLARGAQVRCSGGMVIGTDRLVLCTGHARPDFPWSLDRTTAALPGRIDDPWSEDALSAVSREAEVLILGTGLTMADTVVDLLARGHLGRIVAVSRRGLLPQGHAAYEEPPEFLGDAPPPASPRALMKLLRRRLREADASGRAWQMVIEGLRKPLPEIWDRWPEPARRSALRHLRPYWDTRRFRVAPQVEDALRLARASGQLQVVAGRILDVGHADGRRFRITLRRRGAAHGEAACFDALISCLGPNANPARSRDPLMSALVRSGRVMADPLGLGLAVDAGCRVLDGTGRPHRDIYALGPLTRSRFPEAIGAPEISVQAAALATSLTAAIPGSS